MPFEGHGAYGGAVVLVGIESCLRCRGSDVPKGPIVSIGIVTAEIGGHGSIGSGIDGAGVRVGRRSGGGEGLVIRSAATISGSGEPDAVLDTTRPLGGPSSGAYSESR